MNYKDIPTIIEPSDTDLGDSPDSVRDYLYYLELENEHLKELQARCAKISAKAVAKHLASITELEKENATLIQAGCDLCFYAEGTEEHRLAREKFPCRYD